MDVTDFAAQRPRLVAIAYRILGGHGDAEDVVQDAWLRLEQTAGVDDPPAWLTTVVTRLCLDRLRRRRGSAIDEDDLAGRVAADDPESDAVLAARVGDAMQVVLDSLAPAERAALVLHDVFGYPFDEVAAIMGRSGSAVRQLASRARRKTRGAPEPDGAPSQRAEGRRVVEAFLAAARGGDLKTLLTLLAPEVVMRADLAGQQMGTAALYDGAAAVADRFTGARGAIPVTIDGELGAAWIHRTVTKTAFVFHVAEGLVREVELIADPAVLTTMTIVPLHRRDSTTEKGPGA